jgi:hypothetical protein
MRQPDAAMIASSLAPAVISKALRRGSGSHKATLRLRAFDGRCPKLVAIGGHLNERGQPFSAPLIASLLLPVRPVSTVTRVRAASCETRDRQFVQRRGCNPPRDVRTLALSSAQPGSFSARMKPDTLHRSSPSHLSPSIVVPFTKKTDQLNIGAGTIAFARPIPPARTTPSQPFQTYPFRTG